MILWKLKDEKRDLSEVSMIYLVIFMLNKLFKSYDYNNYIFWIGNKFKWWVLIFVLLRYCNYMIVRENVLYLYLNKKYIFL